MRLFLAKPGALEGFVLGSVLVMLGVVLASVRLAIIHDSYWLNVVIRVGIWWWRIGLPLALVIDALLAWKTGRLRGWLHESRWILSIGALWVVFSVIAHIFFDRK